MRRLKTVRRPPIYPKTPGHLPCSSLTHPLPLSSRRPSVSFGGFGLRAMNGYLLTIDGTDNETVSTMRERHPRELRAGEAALDAIIRGLTEFGPENRHRDDDLESARLFLATRTFNSLRAAFQVLERGYYQQAMALVRMAMEDRLVVRNL